MEAMRQSWTDERLDDFRGETARNFEQVDKRFDRFERRMEDGFKEMRAEFAALRREMDERFEALHRMMFRFSAMMITALIAALATFATQL
jgi:hypothetical protein